jgi:membrane protein
MVVTKKLKIFLKEVVFEISRNKLADASAALSFRSLLAIVPSFAFLVIVLGFVLGRERVSNWIFSYLEKAFGTEVVFLEQAVESTFVLMTSFIFSVIFFVIALWSSVGLIHNTRRVFFSIYSIEISGKSTIKKSIKSRLISFMYMLLIFALIVLLILGQGLIAIVLNYVGKMTDIFNLSIILNAFNYLVFFGLISLIFGLVYLFMSAGTLHFRPIFWGSIFSASFFIVFNILLSFYVSYSFSISLYGAFSFLVILLVWIYYSSFTLFLGGVITNVLNKKTEKQKGKKNPVYI